MDKAERARMYEEFLRAEGYQPEVDEDGDVRFKKEGGLYFIDVDERDEQFFRLCFPNFWSVESDEERGRALAACDYSNSLSKVAKVYLVHNTHAWAAIELFFAEPEEFRGVFERCIGALQNGVRNFVKRMQEEQ